MLSDSRKADLAYKAFKGVAQTSINRASYEETHAFSFRVLNSQIWLDNNLIPVNPPEDMSNAQIIGVVQRYIDVTLTEEAGKANSFYISALKNAIDPERYGSGYNIVLKDSTGSVIPVGFANYEVNVDSGIVTFDDGTILSNKPISVSFYKYVGRIGIFDATEVLKGLVARATQEEVNVGTVEDKYVSPKTLSLGMSVLPFATFKGDWDISTGLLPSENVKLGWFYKIVGSYNFTDILPVGHIVKADGLLFALKNNPTLQSDYFVMENGLKNVVDQIVTSNSTNAVSGAAVSKVINKVLFDDYQYFRQVIDEDTVGDVRVYTDINGTYTERFELVGEVNEWVLKMELTW